MHSNIAAFSETTPLYSSQVKPIEKEDDLIFLLARQKELEQRNVLISQEVQSLSYTIEKKRLSAQLANQKMHCIFENVYLGDIFAYQDWIKEARENPSNSYSLISVVKINSEIETPGNVEHLKFDLSDNQSDWAAPDGIKSYLKAVFQWLDRARLENKPLLIHCLAGKSRSVTILAAYLMWSCGQRWESVLTFIQSKRWGAFPSDELKHVLSEHFQRKLITLGLIT